MAIADKYRLLVAGLSGSVWIAKLTKQPYLMSTDRRKVPEEEFINAVIQYTVSKLELGAKTLQITEDGNVIAEIVIKDPKLLK